MKCYLSYLLGLTSLFISIISTKSIDTVNISKSNNEKTINEDKYYLIYVNNDHEEYKVYNDNKNQKRQESQVYIENLVDEINELIIKNRNTYDDPEKLDEIEEAAHLKKRNHGQLEFYRYAGSEFVYPISSVNDKVVLYAYLSKTLAKTLPSKFENVMTCSPDESTFSFFHQNYNVEEILAETQWKDLSIRENADKHLSLISQGIYNKNLGKGYDNNYYYPSTAGKDVDIIILDSSFNFNYTEFSNTDERTIECVGIIKDGKVSNDVSQGCNVSQIYHGETVSVVAAGLTHGVANLANVHGLVLETDERGGIKNSNILAGVQYIYENMITHPHKTVINLSLGGIEDSSKPHFKQYKEAIDAITEKGGIVVAAAGNDGVDLNIDSDDFYMIPCEFDSVICVGGTYNDHPDFNKMYRPSSFTNYGKNVTLYAPSFVNVEIIKDSEVVMEKTKGTSFSAPIVTGLIANIIGENMAVDYTTKSMTEKLLEDGKSNTIKLFNEEMGIFANNGKKTLYYDDVFEEPTNTEVDPKEQCFFGGFFPCCETCEADTINEMGRFGMIENGSCGIKFDCIFD